MAVKYPISVTLQIAPNSLRLISATSHSERYFSDHMFVADYYGKQWVNPRIEPYGNLSLAPSNLALHYGQSIFEGMKATKINGEPVLFRADQHARRLNLSAERMCMPAIPEDLFLQGLKMLVDLDRAFIPEADDHALYIRPMMFATDEYFGVHASQKYKFIIFTGPVGPYYPTPVRLWVEAVFTRAAQGGAGEAQMRRQLRLFSVARSTR